MSEQPKPGKTQGELAGHELGSEGWIGWYCAQAAQLTEAGDAPCTCALFREAFAAGAASAAELPEVRG